MTSALPFPFSLLDNFLSSLETPRNTNPIRPTTTTSVTEEPQVMEGQQYSAATMRGELELSEETKHWIAQNQEKVKAEIDKHGIRLFGDRW